MPAQGWYQTLIQAQANGTAVTLTAEGSLLPGQAKFTLPANFLDYIGKGLRIQASGRISNIITTPGTLTLRVKFGSIIVAQSSAMQLNAVAKTDVTWWLDWYMNARTLGPTTTATLMHTGYWTSESVVGSPLPSIGGSGTFLIPASAPAVGTGFDSTVANAVDLAAIFSLTGNSIQAHQYVLQSID